MWTSIFPFLFVAHVAVPITKNHNFYTFVKAGKRICLPIECATLQFDSLTPTELIRNIFLFASVNHFIGDPLYV